MTSFRTAFRSPKASQLGNLPEIVHYPELWSGVMHNWSHEIIKADFQRTQILKHLHNIRVLSLVMPKIFIATSHLRVFASSIHAEIAAAVISSSQTRTLLDNGALFIDRAEGTDLDGRLSQLETRVSRLPWAAKSNLNLSKIFNPNHSMSIASTSTIDWFEQNTLDLIESISFSLPAYDIKHIKEQSLKSKFVEGIQFYYEDFAANLSRNSPDDLVIKSMLERMNHFYFTSNDFLLTNSISYHYPSFDLPLQRSLNYPSINPDFYCPEFIKTLLFHFLNERDFYNLLNCDISDLLYAKQKIALGFDYNEFRLGIFEIIEKISDDLTKFVETYINKSPNLNELLSKILYGDGKTLQNILDVGQEATRSASVMANPLAGFGVSALRTVSKNYIDAWLKRSRLQFRHPAVYRYMKILKRHLSQ